MNFRFTDEQRLIRSEVRALLEREWTAAELRAAWHSDAPALAIRKRLAELGVRGLTVPQSWGGIGGDELDLVLVLEEYGRAAIPDAVAVEAAVAVPLLAAAGGELADTWLPRVATGDANIATVLGGGGYSADADMADLLIVESSGRVVAIEKGGVDLIRQPSIDGARRLFSVSADGGTPLNVDAGHLEMARDRAVFASATTLLGLSERMLEMAVTHAKGREQFGQPIGSFQAVKHRLAQAETAIELARPVVYAAAWSLARSQPDRSIAVTLAKLFANRAANSAARESLQVHGAIGFAAEHDLHLFLKRARALELSSGGTAAQLSRLTVHLQLSPHSSD
jgi:alkylation response protein AidB-like acyl-CoA dehydrogenase